MPITALWKSSPKEIQDKHVQQVIGFAADGRLRDGGEASKEFRDFLALVPSDFLTRYANECLNGKFENSGFVLQDVINEVGKRLGFNVVHGRYRGVVGEIGFDGLWRSPDGNTIIIEVKTTDAYRIDLETISAYRRNLIGTAQIKENESSILVVVGRDDTGDLEAQVRGSRHAWDIRLISVEALIHLMHLKEDLDDPKIMGKIRTVLMPQEFTRVDGIIDLVFSAAEEVKKEEEITEIADDDEEDLPKSKIAHVNFRDDCAKIVQAHLGQPLIKRSFAVYSSPDENLTIICINSREYQRSKYKGYWFAFHPHQRDLILTDAQAFVVLGCGSTDQILLIPGKIFLTWLERCHMTKLKERFYWHIRINKGNNGYVLLVKKGFDAVDLNQYLLRQSKPRT